MGAFHSKPILKQVATEANIPHSTARIADDLSASWKSYDYVIVGGGTAGCVLAGRLSEDPNRTVLLVEAGKSHEGHLLTSIPLAFSKNFKTDIDWSYQSSSQAPFNDRQLTYPQGKILGGTSAINCLIYHRGSPQDFEEWERVAGAAWSYKSLLPYFHKSEGYLHDLAFSTVQRGNHGSAGPWGVRPQVTRPPAINDILLKACSNMGISQVKDLCTPQGTLGAAEFMTFTSANGTRNSSATAYLTKEVLARPNLVVLTGTRVEKVFFSSTNPPRAVGVQLAESRQGPKYCVRASLEVIMSAGAFATPQLLQLSGIGPAEVLERMKIPPIAVLPAVGRHLLDQPASGTLIIHTKSTERVTLDHLNKPLLGGFALLKWMLTGGGPMAGLAIPGGAFLNTSLPLGSIAQTRPDIEILWAPMVVLDASGEVQSPNEVEGVTFGVIALNPHSEGSVTIASNSAWDSPCIDPNFFAESADIDTLARGIRVVLQLAQTEPFRSIIDQDADEKTMPWIYPGNKHPDEISDNDLKVWIAKNGNGTWHPTSSARMGALPETSVVDPLLRVHGVAGLRIVDASVFPGQISGHPTSVVIALAEKAAELMKCEAQ